MYRSKVFLFVVIIKQNIYFYPKSVTADGTVSIVAILI